MKKLGWIAISMVALFVCGPIIIDFLDGVSEDVLLQIGVPFVGVAVGLLVGLPLRAFFTHLHSERHHEQQDG